jgi:hypothetical protein
VEVFVYGSGGLLAGSVTAPPRNVNLTAEGTADWAHWGHTSSTSFNHKSHVQQQISDFTRLGDNPVDRYTNNFTSFTWTDGTPIEEVVNSTTGVFVTGFSNGFEITLPADTARRTLNVYAGLYGAAGRFQAFLSDASAKAYVDTSLSNFYGDSYAVYTLSYAAASAGQTLSVRYKSRLLLDYDYGNVTLQAASLVSSITNPPPAPVLIENAAWMSGRFSFSFGAESGRTYQVQRADAPGGQWQVLTNVIASSTTANITDGAATIAKRFYRVESR